MNQDNSLSVKRYTAVFSALIISISCLLIASTFSNSHKTGLLYANSTDTNATLSISGPSKGGRFIGVGSAKIRLQPGQYLLSASDNGKQSAIALSISEGQSVKETVNPDTVAPLPTVEGINFSGLNSLTNAGLTDTQVSKIQYDIFAYRTGTKNVSVIGGSIYPEPHDPNTDIGFTLDFDVRIDYVLYKAKASYAGLSDLTLKIYSTTGKLLYSTT